MSAAVTTPNVFRLTAADAPSYLELRRTMLLSAPWAFGTNPEDDPTLELAHLERMLDDELWAVFGVARPDAERAGVPGRDESRRPSRPLGAVAGITRSPDAKFRHRARIWGVFVEAELRGRGFGRAVVLAAVHQASHWQGVDYVDLGVSERSPEALRLYESCGFRAWGREPAATEVEGRRYDEIHLTLRLR